MRATGIIGKVLRTRPAEHRRSNEILSRTPGPNLDMLIQVVPDAMVPIVPPLWHRVGRDDFEYVPSANRGDAQGWLNVARMQAGLPIKEP